MAEAGFAGADDGLGAVGDLEFAEDAGDVVANRFWAEEEEIGDFSVAAATGDQAEDFPLAVDLEGEGRGWRRGWMWEWQRRRQ